jgi:hypothetical protein
LSAETVRPGNIGNGAIRKPASWNFDFSLGKNFPITEKLRIQFRADMFNALNHTILSGLVAEITNARFGQLTSTNGARLIQLNAHLWVGGRECTKSTAPPGAAVLFKHLPALP